MNAVAPASTSSTISLVGISPAPPMNAKSTRLFLLAIAFFCSKASTVTVAGCVLGISTTVVTPPAVAALVPDSKFSLSGNPGSRRCTCMSIIPGRTSLPEASMTLSALGSPDLMIPAIFPLSIINEASIKPVARASLPFLMIISTVISELSKI